MGNDNSFSFFSLNTERRSLEQNKIASITKKDSNITPVYNFSQYLIL